MNHIYIRVTQRHAVYEKDNYNPVCDNDDYVVRFQFDAEWDGYEHKTARFVTENGYTDVLFTGTECTMPPLANVQWVEVGVYAGDLKTSTPAYISIDRSILCGDNAVHPEPPEDVYNQLLGRLNTIEQTIEQTVNDYLKENPVQGGVDFTTDETLTLSTDKILSVNRAFSVEQDNTLPITSAAVHETVGNINALLATI